MFSLVCVCKQETVSYKSMVWKKPHRGPYNSWSLSFILDRNNTQRARLLQVRWVFRSYHNFTILCPMCMCVFFSFFLRSTLSCATASFSFEKELLCSLCVFFSFLGSRSCHSTKRSLKSHGAGSESFLTVRLVLVQVPLRFSYVFAFPTP